jgi:uncharacterized protein YgiM (DUF1202 family)
MRHRFLFARRSAFILLFVACGAEPPAVEQPAIDTRDPIAVKYVGAPELHVREKPSADAPVMATYQYGEAMPILTDQGEWVEVRSGIGSGWARAEELTTAEEKVAQDKDPQARFRVMPMPVSAPGARGEIYLEADVNSDGDVVGVRIITNTTGSESLAEQNVAALRAGKFHPMIVQNERKPFKYYHRVTY